MKAQIEAQESQRLSVEKELAQTRELSEKGLSTTTRAFLVERGC